MCGGGEQHLFAHLQFLEALSPQAQARDKGNHNEASCGLVCRVSSPEISFSNSFGEIRRSTLLPLGFLSTFWLAWPFPVADFR